MHITEPCMHALARRFVLGRLDCRQAVLTAKALLQLACHHSMGVVCVGESDGQQHQALCQWHQISCQESVSV